MMVLNLPFLRRGLIVIRFSSSFFCFGSLEASVKRAVGIWLSKTVVLNPMCSFCTPYSSISQNFRNFGHLPLIKLVMTIGSTPEFVQTADEWMSTVTQMMEDR